MTDLHTAIANGRSDNLRFVDPDRAAQARGAVEFFRSLEDNPMPAMEPPLFRVRPYAERINRYKQLNCARCGHRFKCPTHHTKQLLCDDCARGGNRAKRSPQ